LDRFGRDYELRAQILGGEVIVRPPMRIAFQGDKSIAGGLNKIQIKIYNLAEKKRLALVKDSEDSSVRIPLQLSVGYQGNRELIFKGTVHTGSNSRQGADMITTLDGLDGGFDFLNSYTSRTVEGGRRAIDTCLKDMPNTQVGKITKRPTLTRPKVLVGNSAKLIEDTIGDGETWFIDDEQLFIMKDNEVVSRFIPVVSAETGLLNTPEREQKKVTFRTLMNPAVKIGRRVNLLSSTAPHLNGVYKIETISYQGDNYGDEWSQTCTGFLAAGVTVL
jgi:hypothetical protein